MEKRKQNQNSDKSVIVHTDLGEFGIPQVVSLEHLNSGKEVETNLDGNLETHEVASNVDEFKIPNSETDQAEAKQAQARQDALENVHAVYGNITNPNGDILNIDDLHHRIERSKDQGSLSFEYGDPRNDNDIQLDYSGVGLGIDDSRHSGSLIHRPDQGRNSHQLEQGLKEVKGVGRNKEVSQTVGHMASAALQTVSAPLQWIVKNLKKLEDRMRDKFKDFYA